MISNRILRFQSSSAAQSVTVSSGGSATKGSHLIGLHAAYPARQFMNPPMQSSFCGSMPQAPLGSQCACSEDNTLDVVLLVLDLRLLSAFLVLDLARCDAALYRTYVQAEVASYALIIQFRLSLLFVPVDCLVSSIVA